MSSPPFTAAAPFARPRLRTTERTRGPHSLSGVATVPGAQALSPVPLSIVRQDAGDAVTLTVGGEIDLESAPALENELRVAERLEPRRVVLDLAAIDFLDSTGIHLLFEAQERAETTGRQFVLRHVPDHVHRLFTLTGLISRLTVE